MLNQTDINDMDDQGFTSEDTGESVDAYAALAEFIRSFNGSLDPRLWLSLVKEELDELYAESPKTPEHLKEYADLLYVYTGLNLLTGNVIGALISDEEITKWTKLTGRAERALQEYFLYYGSDIVNEAFKRVHESNMSKLDATGKPILREDGKVLKGPNYKAPDLTDLINLFIQTQKGNKK